MRNRYTFLLQVVIVSGETGCGKTTQLPQFILEDADESMMQCNIICTQPRRISAVSVATRVANERGEQVGDTVGYAVRLDQKRSHFTRLQYCTTGVLLRMMVRFLQEVFVPGLQVSHFSKQVRSNNFLERGLVERKLIIYADLVGVCTASIEDVVKRLFLV